MMNLTMPNLQSDNFNALMGHPVETFFILFIIIAIVDYRDKTCKMN